MTGALRLEWVRITTIASSYWLSGLALGFTLLISGFAAVFAPNDAFEDVGGLDVLGTFVVTGGAGVRLVPVMALPFVMVIGVLAVGHDYRYGTNKAVLTAVPNRIHVFFAKLLVVAGWAAATALAILLVNLLLAVAFVGTDSLGDVVRPMWSFVLLMVGHAWAAMGVTWALRNQVGSLVLTLVYTYVIEAIISGLLQVMASVNDSDVNKLAEFLPAGAGRRTLWSPYDFWQLDFEGGAYTPMDLAPSYFVFWGGVLITLGVGLALFLKRDA